MIEWASLPPRRQEAAMGPLISFCWDAVGRADLHLETYSRIKSGELKYTGRRDFLGLAEANLTNAAERYAAVQALGWALKKFEAKLRESEARLVACRALETLRRPA